MGSILCFLRHYVTEHPTALFSVVTRLNGSCRTRQNSTALAELDGSCRTRRFLQKSTVLAELGRTRRFLQNSADLAELDGSCRTQRFLQNSAGLAELDGSCRTRRFLQNSTALADRTRRFLQNSTVLQDSIGFAVSSPFWPLRRLIHRTEINKAYHILRFFVVPPFSSHAICECRLKHLYFVPVPVVVNDFLGTRRAPPNFK